MSEMTNAELMMWMRVHGLLRRPPPRVDFNLKSRALDMVTLRRVTIEEIAAVHF